MIFRDFSVYEYGILKRTFVPYSTPQDLFWKHHEAILPLQWIFDSYKGVGRFFEGLVWSQFLHYRKNILHGSFFGIYKPHFGWGPKFFSGRDRLIYIETSISRVLFTIEDWYFLWRFIWWKSIFNMYKYFFRMSVS